MLAGSKVIMVIALAAVAAALPLAAPCAAESKVALIVGNADYPGSERLDSPARDAADMCAALRRLGYDTQCHTNVRDRRQFLVLLQKFAARLTTASKAVIYYAGHAVQIKGENYLIPTAAQLRTPADVATALVSVSQVLEQFESTHGAFNILILDACRNNPFVAGAGRPSDNAAPTSGVRGVQRALGKEAREMSYGLGTIRDAPVGSIVLYATGANEAAYESTDRNGLLTKHVLAHLETPGITVEEMIKRVTVGVQDETLATIGWRQTPFVYSSFTGEFCFAGCPPKLDPSELERLRRERAELQQRLEQTTTGERDNKNAQRVFMPPTL
jgi:uncharacterized caspase-like protein